MDKSIENKSGEVIKSEELDKSKVMLVFDYDGTIQETMKIYAPAILDIAKRLRTIYGVQVENPSYERMESWLGLRNDEMWAAFAPELPADARAAAAARVGAYMRMLVRDGADPWYAGARKTLEKSRDIE